MGALWQGLKQIGDDAADIGSAVINGFAGNGLISDREISRVQALSLLEARKEYAGHQNYMAAQSLQLSDIADAVNAANNGGARGDANANMSKLLTALNNKFGLEGEDRITSAEDMQAVISSGRVNVNDVMTVALESSNSNATFVNVYGVAGGVRNGSLVADDNGFYTKGGQMVAGRYVEPEVNDIALSGNSGLTFEESQQFHYENPLALSNMMNSSNNRHWNNLAAIAIYEMEKKKSMAGLGALAGAASGAYQSSNSSLSNYSLQERFQQNLQSSEYYGNIASGEKQLVDGSNVKTVPYNPATEPQSQAYFMWADFSGNVPLPASMENEYSTNVRAGVAPLALTATAILGAKLSLAAPQASTAGRIVESSTYLKELLTAQTLVNGTIGATANMLATGLTNPNASWEDYLVSGGFGFTGGALLTPFSSMNLAMRMNQ